MSGAPVFGRILCVHHWTGLMFGCIRDPRSVRSAQAVDSMVRMVEVSTVASAGGEAALFAASPESPPPPSEVSSKNWLRFLPLFHPPSCIEAIISGVQGPEVARARRRAK